VEGDKKLQLSDIQLKNFGQKTLWGLKYSFLPINSPRTKHFQPHILHVWKELLQRGENFPTGQDFKGVNNCALSLSPARPRRQCAYRGFVENVGVLVNGWWVDSDSISLANEMSPSV